MASYTPSLGLELITPGSQAGLWGNTTNNSLNLIDQAITGVTPLSFASASGSVYTLTDFNGAQDESRSAVLNITGSATGGNTVVIPNKQKTYLVRNFTGQDVTFRTPTPSATYTVGAGYSILIFCDGNNNVFTGIAAPSVGTLLVNAGGTGSTTFTAGFVKSPGGTSALTSSATVNAGTELSGVTPVSNGGTGQSSLAAGALLFGNGTSGVGSFVGSAVGQVATWSGSAWQAVAPSAAGVLSIAGSGINVSPATGNVTITLTSGNVTGALGYTPVSPTGAGATGTWGINISGNANTASSATTATSASTATTASNANSLGGVAASGYMTLSGSQTITGAKLFTGGIQSQAYNMTTISSIYAVSANVTISANGGNQFVFNGSTNNATASLGSWINGSDERIKENIHSVTDGLGLICKLNPVKYSFKPDNRSSANRYGLIAQELEKVVPEVVFTSEEDVLGISEFKSVSYTELIPLLIKSIQQLKQEVDALKAAK